MNKAELQANVSDVWNRRYEDLKEAIESRIAKRSMDAYTDYMVFCTDHKYWAGEDSWDYPVKDYERVMKELKDAGLNVKRWKFLFFDLPAWTVSWK